MQRPDFGREFYQRTGSFGVKDLSVYLNEANREGCLTVPDAALAAAQFHALIKDPLLWPQRWAFKRGRLSMRVLRLSSKLLHFFESVRKKITEAFVLR